jgi:hypothetical protein
MSTQEALHCVAKSAGSAGKSERIRKSVNWKSPDLEWSDAKETTSSLIGRLPRDNGEFPVVPPEIKSAVATLGVALVDEMAGVPSGTPVVSDVVLARLVNSASADPIKFTQADAALLNRSLRVRLSDAMYESEFARRVVAGIPAMLATPVDPSVPWEPWFHGLSYPAEDESKAVVE